VPEDLPELADIQRLAAAFDPQEVQLYYQIAVHGRNEIGLAPDEYAGFTMTLLRMLAFRPGQGGAEGAAPSGSAAARPSGAAPAARAAAAAAPPARAASAAVASHAAVAPPPPPPPVARPPAPPAAVQAPPPPPPAAAVPAMNSARAAINAALEAARAASGGRNAAPRRSTAMSNQADAAAAPAASSEPSPPPAEPPAAPAASRPAPPWDQGGAQAAAPAQVQAAPAAAPQVQAQTEQYQEMDSGDEPPSWVTEFSDDTAVAQDAPAMQAAPAAARAPAVPRHAYVITPVPEIDWDGNWPALAAGLALRGVSQQLALQTELVSCGVDGNVTTFKLRVPIDTLRASGNSEKLAAALQERFTGTKVAVDIEIGQVWYTASAEAIAYREERQRQAEDTVNNDPFVRDVMRDLGAFVVPGSVRPPPLSGAAA